MLPVAHSSQRFHAIHQTLNQLPEVVTRIISEYDYFYDDLRKIVNSIKIVNIKKTENEYDHIPKRWLDLTEGAERYKGESLRLLLVQAWSDNDRHPADIIISLIDKFESWILVHFPADLDKRMVFTVDDGSQREVQYHLQMKCDSYNTLMKLVGGAGRCLVLKDGDMSHRKYSNLRCTFWRATFVNVNFTGTIFTAQLFQEASFIDCDLTNVIFYCCNLEGARFSGSILKNTIFRNFNSISKAVFEHVIFDNTQFIENGTNNGFYNSECNGVVGTDRLFLAKLRMYCKRVSKQHVWMPKSGVYYLDNTSFEYTSPSKPFQKWLSDCPIL